METGANTKSKLTPLGREIRKLRIDTSDRLLDLARALAVSPAFLSAIETGRKQAPERVLEQIALFFNGGDVMVKHLKELAEISAPTMTFRIAEADDEAKALVAAFGRRFTELNSEQIKAIRDVLQEKKEP